MAVVAETQISGTPLLAVEEIGSVVLAFRMSAFIPLLS